MDQFLEILAAIATLSAMEIVLGIDNIVFIAILSANLPPEQRQKARRYGLLAAGAMRIVLLLLIKVILGLTTTLFTVAGHDFSGKDLILVAGGLFLLAKATMEIHHKLEGHRVEDAEAKAGATLKGVVFQIMLMDAIFSIDSVLTAVGMVDAETSWGLPVMIGSIVLAVGVMIAFARPVSDFVERHPTVKMLALSFLLLIGMVLVAEGFGAHVGKGYIYSAMGFSLFVEMLNLRATRARRAKRAKAAAEPVKLRESHLPED